MNGLDKIKEKILDEAKLKADKMCIRDSDKTEYALNDVVISKSIPGRIADFKLLLNEKPIVSYRACLLYTSLYY